MSSAYLLVSTPTWMKRLLSRSLEHTSFTEQQKMSQRQSTTPVAPSKKALKAARGLLSARQRNLPSSMSFIALGDSQTSKAVELPGFKGSYISF